MRTVEVVWTLVLNLHIWKLHGLVLRVGAKHGALDKVVGGTRVVQLHHLVNAESSFLTADDSRVALLVGLKEVILLLVDLVW